ncbi:response regulator transcription factor [soil metagenome]
MSEPIRLFLVDDHEIVRRGLAELFNAEKDMIVVGDRGTVSGSLDQMIVVGTTVAILDARLPDGTGIDLCRELKSASPDTRAIILTSYDDDEAVLAAVLAGADGYLLKEVRATNLVDAVRRVAGGASLLDPTVTARVLERARAAGPLAVLTPREREILDLIADGLSNREIAERVFLAEKTVKNHVSGILAKLGMQRRTQAAVLAAQFRHGPRRPQ